VEGVQRALQETVGDDGVPAGGDDGEAHARSAEVAFDCDGLVVKGVFGLPEAQFQVRGEVRGEETGVPVGKFRGGEESFDLFGAVGGQHPLLDGGVDGVEFGDLDEDGGDGRRAAGDQFEVSEGGEEDGTAALRILPVLAGLETEGAKEAVELVERAGRGDGADQRNSLNHRFDCIVWSCEEMPVSYETLLCEVKDQVATVTLNRPKVLHALNTQVFNELETVFRGLKADHAVRVILLTGAGEKAFAAGADINEIAALNVLEGEAKARVGQGVFRLIETCGKPVIALVNGFALGGGCELAMACTMRLASETARMGQPEVKLGLVPGYGGTQRLPRLVGQPAALKLLLTGGMIGAAEALRIGLVDEVVAAEGLMARGLELAQAIVAMAPLAVAGCIEAVQLGSELGLEDALELEAKIFGRLCGSADKAEGTTAFLEKRAAVWTGR
jgi:enoyl-CoA hydratase